jgi:hypothetical protein
MEDALKKRGDARGNAMKERLGKVKDEKSKKNEAQVQEIERARIKAIRSLADEARNLKELQNRKRDIIRDYFQFIIIK